MVRVVDPPSVQPRLKRFRDTLWFKRGALDDEARRSAAPGEAASPTAADLLPVEDRYLDDGSVTHEDSVQFSVHTGRTQAVPRVAVEPLAAGAKDPLATVARELSWSRGRLAMLGASVAAVGTLVAVLAR